MRDQINVYFTIVDEKKRENGTYFMCKLILH